MYEWWWVQGIGRAPTALTPASCPQLQLCLQLNIRPGCEQTDRKTAQCAL